jgi:hypothetical protein
MSQTREDILNICKERSFKDEHHERFIFIGSICNCLAWDAWSTAEFYLDTTMKDLEREISELLEGR